MNTPELFACGSAISYTARDGKTYEAVYLWTHAGTTHRIRIMRPSPSPHGNGWSEIRNVRADRISAVSA